MEIFSICHGDVIIYIYGDPVTDIMYFRYPMSNAYCIFHINWRCPDLSKQNWCNWLPWPWHWDKNFWLMLKHDESLQAKESGCMAWTVHAKIKWKSDFLIWRLYLRTTQRVCNSWQEGEIYKLDSGTLPLLGFLFNISLSQCLYFIIPVFEWTRKIRSMCEIMLSQTWSWCQIWLQWARTVPWNPETWDQKGTDRLQHFEASFRHWLVSPIFHWLPHCCNLHQKDSNLKECLDVRTISQPQNIKILTT